MTATLGARLDALAPAISDALLAGDARAALRAVAEELPAEFGEALGFEVPLTDARPVADFAVQLASPGARQRLARWSGGATPAVSRARAGIRSFARTWADPGSPAHRALASVWLEFDVEPAAGLSGVPAVFVALQGGSADTVQVALDAVETMAGTPVGAAGRAAVDALLAGLPPGAEPCQVGTMLSRNLATVRVCVRGLSPQSLPRYLRDVGLATAAVVAAEQLEVLPDGAALAVALDVSGVLLPRVGIEVSLTGNRQLEGRVEPRWDDFLAGLEARGLCTSAKRAGVRAWAGVERTPTVHGFTFRGLSHVKLDLSPDTTMKAKAYIGTLPDRLSLLFSDHPAALV